MQIVRVSSYFISQMIANTVPNQEQLPNTWQNDTICISFAICPLFDNHDSWVIVFKLGTRKLSIQKKLAKAFKNDFLIYRRKALRRRQKIQRSTQKFIS